MTKSWEPFRCTTVSITRDPEKIDEFPAWMVDGAAGSTWSLATTPTAQLPVLPTQHDNISSKELLKKLTPSNDDRDEQNAEDKSVEDGLPPVDGGRRAWLYMIGAFMTEGFMWGFLLTFGVYEQYYQTHPPFEGNKYLPVIGTLCSGMSSLGCPFIAPFTIRYPMYQQHMIWAGWLLCILALALSSFATQLWHLIISQGLVYGFGFLLIYYPMMSMLNEWWIKRRGFAFGLMFGSAGICGIGLPFLVEIMLRNHGYATTLRVSSLALFVIVGPNILLLRSRNPPKRQAIFEFDTSLLRRPPFLFISLSNMFQGLVAYLPPIFISSYASAVGLSVSQGTLILSLLNISQVCGQIAIGYISDHTSLYIPMGISSFVAGLAVLLPWGMGSTFAQLLIFGVVYGIFAGSYGVLFCRFVTTLTSDRATGLWLYSIFEFQRGLGSIVGGLMAGSLVTMVADSGGYGDGQYKTLILVIGCSFLISSVGGFGWFFRAGSKKA